MPLLCFFSCKKGSIVDEVDTEGRLLESFEYFWKPLHAKALYTSFRSSDNNLVASIAVSGEDVHFQQSISIPLVYNTARFTIGTHIDRVLKEQMRSVYQRPRDLLIVSCLLDDMLDAYAVEHRHNPKVPAQQGLSFLNAFMKGSLRESKHRALSQKGIFLDILSSFVASSAYAIPYAKHSGQITHTPYDGFNRGLSAFIFNEDIHINAKNMLALFTLNKAELAQKHKGARSLKPVLEKLPIITTLQDILETYKEVYRVELESGFEQAKKDGLIGKKTSFPERIEELGRFCFFGFGTEGSTHGCCGNYNGCCAFWHPICYVHDILCTECKPAWFCLSGCVPDKELKNPQAFIGKRNVDGIGIDNLLEGIDASTIHRLRKVMEDERRKLVAGIATFRTID